VGANSQLIAYGFNRDDYTYIPGGVISGASFKRLGFMDLKNFPYYFNQTEYVIHGAASYIFDVLAAQSMLQHPPATNWSYRLERLPQDQQRKDVSPKWRRDPCARVARDGPLAPQAVHPDPGGQG
jgi:hypothetical protein